MNDAVDTFKTEANEHLSLLEGVLLELELAPQNKELIDTAFRSIHTIKGAGGMFGFQQLTNFTHHLETVLDKIRKGVLVFNSDLIGIFLDAGDLIGGLLDHTVFTPEQQQETEGLLARLYDAVDSISAGDDIVKPGVSPASDNVSSALGNAIPSSSSVSPSSSKASPAGGNASTLVRTQWNQVYRIQFTPDRDSFRSGLDVTPILRELHSFGPCQVTSDLSVLPDFDELDPESSYLSWAVEVVSAESRATIDDTFMFVAEDWQIDVVCEDSENPTALTQPEPADAETRSLPTLPADTSVSAAQMDGLNQTNSLDGESGNGLAGKAGISNATGPTSGKPLAASEANDPTIRVPASRLDKLMNLVGELVIVQARLNQFAAQEHNEIITSISEELDLLTTQMRDHTFSIRMLPIGTTFGKFRRLVRDLSKELNKSIQLNTEGGETELDKMVLDKLSDPLIHLIRNSIDHGIEAEADRLVNNKPAHGTITLTAEHADSHVLIHIRDDGQGLNTQRIRAIAIERQLIEADADLSENEIHQLIFEPGFSTAKVISDISGRGVGMDVVRRSIQELGGSIYIQTRPGEGTDFTVRLPMTLAIIEGLMVRIANEHYVLPLSSVEECIEMPLSLKRQDNRSRIVEVRQSQIPFLILREWFQVRGERPTFEQIVITHVGEERFGFCVDEVVGQYQTVIKRLGRLYDGAEGFSGATILGDGSVAMILDPGALLEAAGRAYSHHDSNQSS